MRLAELFNALVVEGFVLVDAYVADVGEQASGKVRISLLFLVAEHHK